MAEEERILEVTPDFDGKRIDQCLAASFSDCSRSFLQKLLKDGKVSINGKTQKASSKVAAGDAVLERSRPLLQLAAPGVVENQRAAGVDGAGGESRSRFLLILLLRRK